jgi:hypothetical protein
MKKLISYLTVKNIALDIIPLLIFALGFIIAVLEQREQTVALHFIMFMLTGVIILNRHTIKKYVSIIETYRVLVESFEHDKARKKYEISELKRTLQHASTSIENLKAELQLCKESQPVTPKKNVKQSASKQKDISA